LLEAIMSDVATHQMDEKQRNVLKGELKVFHVKNDLNSYKTLKGSCFTWYFWKRVYKIINRVKYTGRWGEKELF